MPRIGLATVSALCFLVAGISVVVYGDARARVPWFNSSTLPTQKGTSPSLLPSLLGERQKRVPALTGKEPGALPSQLGNPFRTFIPKSAGQGATRIPPNPLGGRIPVPTRNEVPEKRAPREGLARDEVGAPLSWCGNALIEEHKEYNKHHNSYNILLIGARKRDYQDVLVQVWKHGEWTTILKLGRPLSRGMIARIPNFVPEVLLNTPRRPPPDFWPPSLPEACVLFLLYQDDGSHNCKPESAVACTRMLPLDVDSALDPERAEGVPREILEDKPLLRRHPRSDPLLPHRERHVVLPRPGVHGVPRGRHSSGADRHRGLLVRGGDVLRHLPHCMGTGWERETSQFRIRLTRVK